MTVDDPSTMSDDALREWVATCQHAHSPAAYRANIDSARREGVIDGLSWVLDNHVWSYDPVTRIRAELERLKAEG